MAKEKILPAAASGADTRRVTPPAADLRIWHKHGRPTVSAFITTVLVPRQRHAYYVNYRIIQVRTWLTARSIANTRSTKK